jgi:hypothetical protein
MVHRRSVTAAMFASMALGSLWTAPAAAAVFPDRIALPDGWLPEGIAIGRGPVIYAGSRGTGAIYAADLRTGEGQVLVAGQAGAVAVGLDFDRRTNTLFVAGGATGQVRAYDAGTGELRAAYSLSGSPTFLNDIIVTRDAAYVTDSMAPVLYRLPLGPGAALPDPANTQTIPLGGEYTHVSGFNLNGIEATADGRWLIAVHSTLGVLYRIDPSTGVATTIDLGGASVVQGDGLLLIGHTLYVVRNRSNEVVVIDLAADALSGTVTAVLTSPAFDVPTTIAAHGKRLYLVNGRFTTPPTPTTPYDIVAIER